MQEDVQEFLTDIGWADTADNEFTFEQIDGSKSNPENVYLHVLVLQLMWPLSLGLTVPSSVPRTTTLRTLFSRYLDISCVPRRSFFKSIRWFAQDPSESERLSEFCSAEGFVSTHKVIGPYYSAS